MLTRLRTVSGLIVCVLWYIAPSEAHSSIAGTTNTPTAESPATGMFRGNAVRTGVFPGPAPEGPIGRIWTFRASNAILSSPAVAGDAVYVGDLDGYVYALDAATGKQRWRFDAGDALSSSPAIASGWVVFGGYHRRLHAVDAATGRERWRIATGAPVNSSPAIAAGRICVGSLDDHLYAIGEVSGSGVVGTTPVAGPPTAR